ncbi:MAG: chemotaxis protein CheA [Vicinamibacteria bacterium]|nr:chemotaxis protein CheA [Vicinamibacteria bacterium]
MTPRASRSSVVEPAVSSEAEIELRQIAEVFVAESLEGLEAIEQALVVQEGGFDEESVNAIFRVAHTLKGNAASLGLGRLSAFGHALEDTLDAVRHHELAISADLVSLLLEAVDAIREALPGALDGRDEIVGEADLVERLRVLRAAAAAEPAPTPGAAPTGGAHPEAAHDHHADHHHTLRVEVDKLDQLMNLTGQIAIAQGRLRESLGELGAPARQAREVAQGIDQFMGDLQELVMRARMVALGPTLRHSARALRDAAAARGKQAHLTVVGEDVEVDTSVVEHVRDPLTHLVRNAVDHGLETPEERRAAGKDPVGQVVLRAAHEAGSIVIEVRDDGRGVDRARVLARAVALGLLPAETPPEAAEVLEALFAPGFSTTEQVSDLSGRGVGLDVVRRNVEALRGRVEVESELGRGCTIRLRLPLTLAIIAGLAVEAGPDTYVMPLDAVVECVELGAAQEGGDDGETGVLSLRGQPLPFVRLRRAFGTTGRADREVAVVVRRGEQLAGVVVDCVRGERQAVIKALDRTLGRLPGIAGATILGSGRVALILDVNGLLATRLDASHGRTDGGGQKC